MRHAVQPVLRHVVENQKQGHRGPHRNAGQRVFPLRRCGREAEVHEVDDGGLRDHTERGKADDFDDAIVTGLPGLVQQIGAEKLQQAESQIDANDSQH